MHHTSAHTDFVEGIEILRKEVSVELAIALLNYY